MTCHVVSVNLFFFFRNQLPEIDIQEIILFVSIGLIIITETRTLLSFWRYHNTHIIKFEYMFGQPHIFNFFRPLLIIN